LNAPLDGHPDTCSLAATREAVMGMQVVTNGGAHDARKASLGGSSRQLLGKLEVFIRDECKEKDCISGRL
jgi:hypothetical protein